MPTPSKDEAPSYPPENVVEMRLVLRGDNFIYYRHDKIAYVQYIKGSRPPMWQATMLVGKFASLQTPRMPSKLEVLQAVWSREFLDTLF